MQSERRNTALLRQDNICSCLGTGHEYEEKSRSVGFGCRSTLHAQHCIILHKHVTQQMSWLERRLRHDLNAASGTRSALQTARALRRQKGRTQPDPHRPALWWRPLHAQQLALMFKEVIPSSILSTHFSIIPSKIQTQAWDNRIGCH